MAITPIILCGGAGSRLWPLSREEHPKQLLRLYGEKTLLQETTQRLQNLDFPQNPPIVVTSDSYCYLVAEQLRQIAVAEPRIILEPVGRNTAAALTLAALVENQADSLLLVMPSDHAISDNAAFQSAVLKGIKEAESGKIATFGIAPKTAHTGYGYILKGEQIDDDVFALAQFVEKPNAEKAEEYLKSGDYFWNSGIFLMRCDAWLSAIKEYAPEILKACEKALTNGKSNSEFIRLNAEDFEKCPSDSIDYAVAEHLPKDKGSVIALNAPWSDLGAFDALYALQEKDANGNVAEGDVLLHKVKNAFVRAENKLVVCLGVENLAVIDTDDALLVADFNELQNIKAIVQRLKNAERAEVVKRSKVFRPWGSYECIDAGQHFQVKKIVVNPGAALSLQMHYHRAEHWIVVIGTAKVTKGDETILLSENQSIYIPLGTKHRLENPGSIPLELIEVQSGTYLSESDIVRFEDIYGRN